MKDDRRIASILNTPLTNLRLERDAFHSIIATMENSPAYYTIVYINTAPKHISFELRNGTAVVAHVLNISEIHAQYYLELLYALKKKGVVCDGIINQKIANYLAITRNDNVLRRLFAYGLHGRNNEEVKLRATEIIASMDVPEEFSIRWSVHDFDAPFQFILKKGWREIAKTPWVKTVDDPNYKYYLTLFAVLSHWNVKCDAIEAHFVHSEAHGTRGLKTEGRKIAATIS